MGTGGWESPESGVRDWGLGGGGWRKPNPEFRIQNSEFRDPYPVSKIPTFGKLGESATFGRRFGAISGKWKYSKDLGSPRYARKKGG